MYQVVAYAQQKLRLLLLLRQKEINMHHKPTITTQNDQCFFLFISFLPVSYTHLDVYKRQHLDSVIFKNM